MDLLPKSSEEFRSADYWEKFFRKRGDVAFDWYGEYMELCPVLHKYIKTTDKILMVGCGNSNLSADMYDVGYKNMINIDISDTAIRQMNQKNAEKRPDMQFTQMDVTKMSFPDGEFNVVLDKGTLDALLTDNANDTLETVDKMFKEIARVLKMGGRYICISLAQSHIVQKVLQFFPDLGWPVRICRSTKSQADGQEFALPVFAFILTHFKKMANMKPIFEVALYEDAVQRYQDAESTKSAVEEIQHYAMIRDRANHGKDLDDNISLSFFAPGNDAPRYTLYIVDGKKRAKNKFGIFIVPEGRETDWLFNSPEGRQTLISSADFQRLIVVSLSREHQYENMDLIQSELSSKVMELAPEKVDKKVPFLTIGEDIHTRSIQHRGKSDISGDFYVEDVNVDGEMYRRLIFNSTNTFIQSESRLVKAGGKRGKKKSAKMTIDANYLSMGYQAPFIAGIAFVDLKDFLDKKLDLLLIGLGGGNITLFLQQNFPMVSQDVVDLDPAMKEVAEKWFGLAECDSYRVHIADGVQFIRNLSEQNSKKHIVMLDVDCKDTGLGLSAPPQEFTQVDFLNCIDSILHPGGVLILNLAARNKSLRQDVLSRLKSVFQHVFVKSIPEDLNECVYCTTKRRETSVAIPEASTSVPVQVLSAAEELKKLVKYDMDIAHELSGLSLQ